VTTAAPTLDARLAALRERPASGCDKRFGAIAPVTPAALARQRPDLFGGGFITPVLVLHDSALRHNVEAMAAYCAAAGVDLAPHGKTTMAPQLFARQLAAGAWAMTAATAGHLRAYRAFGVPRILLANELTDPAGIAWLAAELATDPGFECFAYADSLAGVQLLDEVLEAMAGQRDGLILTAGGSAYFDIVAAELSAGGWAGRGHRVVLRSGAYIAHDHGLYAGLAVLGAGRRDVSFDAGLPVPLRVRKRGGTRASAAGMRVTRLDDQHAYLSVPPGSGVAPGDVIGLGISHPCTTFDKWRVIPVVDDAYRVIDAVHTFF
jgi:D-serine deaminase-like pyridoxal phosphate-dependent protein